MRIKKVVVLLSVLCLAVASLSASAWLHVRVDSQDSEKLRVNLPLSLVETVLPLIEEKAFSSGPVQRSGIRWDGRNWSVADLRKIWTAVRAEGSFELASFKDKDHRLHVFVEGEHLWVESDEGADEQMQVMIPLAVVDSLLSGEGEELNLGAALEAVKNLGSGDLVLIQADDTKVRVWIDEREQNR